MTFLGFQVVQFWGLLLMCVNYLADGQLITLSALFFEWVPVSLSSFFPFFFPVLFSPVALSFFGVTKECNTFFKSNNVTSKPINAPVSYLDLKSFLSHEFNIQMDAFAHFIPSFSLPYTHSFGIYYISFCWNAQVEQSVQYALMHTLSAAHLSQVE